MFLLSIFAPYYSMNPSQMRLLAALLRAAHIWEGLHRNISTAETEEQVLLLSLLFDPSYLSQTKLHMQLRMR